MVQSLILFCVVLGSALNTALFFVGCSKILRDSDSAPTPAFLLGITHLFAGLFILVMAPLWATGQDAQWDSFPVDFYWLVLFTVFLHFLAKFFHLKALSLVDVALVSPFSGLSPIYTVITGWLILNEFPNKIALLGIMIVVCSLIWLTLGAFVKDCQFALASKASLVKLGIFYAFLSTIPPAFKVVYQKQAILISNPMYFSLLVLLVTGFLTLMGYIIFSWHNFIRQIRCNALMLKLAFISIFLGINTYLFSLALTLDIAANVSAMARTSIVFQVIFAYFFASQREDIGKRFLLAFSVLIGSLIIAFSSNF